MKSLFQIILLFVVCALSAQQKSFLVTGTLKAEDTTEALEAATVYLERIKDSTMVTYTITDSKGTFKLEGDTYDKNLNLFISYVGYETYVKNISIDKKNINLNDINLKVSTNALDEVLIKSKAPITIKKDTLEFNVNSFKTKKDATVEDLLKKLPGVEVTSDGKIKVNGKEVNKILVNGKPFFGNDPTIATKNLTKELIEKVQITDTKTKSEAFAGEEGSDENKTINLTIKEENNKGTFGRVSGGAGTRERYEYAGIVNYFNNDRRLSALAGGNNTNSPGFSFGEIQKMFGGGRSMWVNSNGSFGIDGRSFGGGSGIVTSRTAGANYADDFGKKANLTADYFYSRGKSENVSATKRENILPDRRYFSNSNSNSTADNHNHSANLEFEIEIDSTFLITIEPAFSFSKNESTNNWSQESLDENNILTNTSTSSSFSDAKRNSFQNELGITKRFGSKGAYLRLYLENEINNNENETFLNSETSIFGTTPEEDIRDQITTDDEELNRLGTGVTYRLPLKAKELFLDFTYDFEKTKEQNKRDAFDRDENIGSYNQFNSDLSSDFDYISQSSIPGVELSYKKKKWSTSVEFRRVFRTLESEDRLRPNFSLKRDFKAVELRGRFHYRFSPKASIYSSYSRTNRTPNLSQLQPFADVSNPLNTIVGNPDLKPINRQWMYVSYNGFDFQKGSGFNVYVGGNITDDKVVSKSTILDNNIRETTYTNVNGEYSIYSNLRYSKKQKLDSLRSIKYIFSLNGNFSKSVNFINNEIYANKVRTVTPEIGLEFDWKDVMLIQPNYSVDFTRSKFDIDGFENQEFAQHVFGLETATFLPKQLEWRNDIKYTYNPNIDDGFQKSAWFWNTTLAYSFLKDQASLTLKIYDLLNQNTNSQRRATANYIEDTQSTVLRRYAMLSFSWKFNSLGSKGEVKKHTFWMH